MACTEINGVRLSLLHPQKPPIPPLGSFSLFNAEKPKYLGHHVFKHAKLLQEGPGEEGFLLEEISSNEILEFTLWQLALP